MNDINKKTLEFEYTYQITTEMILMLLQGKKINFDIQGKERLTFYPPQQGVFISNKQWNALKSTANVNQFHILDDIDRNDFTKEELIELCRNMLSKIDDIKEGF